MPKEIDKAERDAGKLLCLSYNDSTTRIAKMNAGELDGLRRTLEGMAERAAWLAAYTDMRHGLGCGDQGHDAAVKAANKTARLLWCKGFGYNGYTDANPIETD